MQILIVEDNEAFFEAVKKEFFEQDEVVRVCSVKKAQEITNYEAFECILVDYDLTDGKGDAVVKHIRAAKSSIPIIAISSHEAGNTALVAAGAVAVCPKMEFRKIRKVIRDAC